MFTVCSHFVSKPRFMTQHYYTYVLAGRDAAIHRGGPIFVGTTRDLKKRLFQHRVGRVSVDKFRIDQLVYVQRYETIEDATTAAERLKAASPEWIKALVERKNPDWRDLSELARERLKRAA